MSLLIQVGSLIILSDSDIPEEASFLRSEEDSGLEIERLLVLHVIDALDAGLLPSDSDSSNPGSSSFANHTMITCSTC